MAADGKRKGVSKTRDRGRGRGSFFILLIVWDDAKKLAPPHFLNFLYFLYIWKYCNDTQLVRIVRNQNLD